MKQLGQSKLWIVGLVVLVLVVGLIIILSINRQSKEGTIKIGVSVPLTGEVTSWGQNALAGATLAANEINDKGGIDGKKIEIIAEDNKCTAEGVNTVNKLINVDKVLGIIGPLCSASAGPAAPILQDNGVPAIVIASAPQIPKTGDYIFSIYPSDKYQGKEAANFIFNTLGKKNIALVYVKNDWGEGLKDPFKERFAELGGIIVYESSTLPTETDFKTELTKIKNSGAEALFFPVQPTSALAAFKQMKELNFNLPFLCGDAIDGEEVITNDYADDVLYLAPSVNLTNDFKTKINSLSEYQKLQVSIVALMGYDAAKAMFSAIEKAGTNKEKIKDALAQTSIQGVSISTIEFDDTGDLKNPNFEVKIIKDKKSIKY